MTLVEPKIVLEINAEGKPNWEFTPSVAEAKPAAAKPSTPLPLSLGRLTIENGTLIFSNSQAGLSVVAEKANFSASVGSIDGPYSLAGGATINGAPLKLDLSVGAKSGVGPRRRRRAGGGRRQARLQGHPERTRTERAGRRPGLELGRQSDRLRRNPGQDRRPAGARRCRRCSPASSASTAASTSRRPPLRPRTSSWRWARTAARARWRLTLKPALAVEGKLAAAKLDLDRWLAAIARPAEPEPPAPPPAGSSAAACANRRPQPARQRGRQARARRRRGRLQPAAGPQRGDRARGEGRRRRRAQAQRHPAGRHGAAGQLDLVGRSGAARGHRRVQPRRTQAARDAGLARDRRLVAAGQQAHAAQP